MVPTAQAPYYFRTKRNPGRPDYDTPIPNERAIINGGILAGDWTTFMNFEITTLGNDRTNTTRQAANFYGTGGKAINMIIHDTGHQA
jgi:hypothetical protein